MVYGKKILALFIVLFCFNVVAVRAASEAVVLGELRAHDTVVIQSGGSNVSITDGVYAYFGGDRVITREKSAAVLVLGKSGAVYVGPSSVATVEGAKGRYMIKLDKGGTRFSFAPGVAFKIFAQGEVIEAEGFKQVAESTSAKIEGIVLIDKGRPVVYAIEGNLVMRSQKGNRHRTIKVGESFTTSDQAGGYVRVVNPTDTPDRRKGGVVVEGGGGTGGAGGALRNWWSGLSGGGKILAGSLMALGGGKIVYDAREHHHPSPAE